MSEIVKLPEEGTRLDEAAEPSSHELLRRWEFLAHASSVLAASLDLETTLGAVARIAVPDLADWCVLYVAEPDGSIRRVAIEHAQPDGAELAGPILRSHRLDPSASTGVSWVIRTGNPIFRPTASAAMLAADVTDPDRLAGVLEPLGIRSWICVPLVARGRTVGALSLVSTRAGRRYDAFDLAFAEELAARAAMAVDNAHLFAEARAAVDHSDATAALLEALLAGTPVGMAFIDRDGRYVRVNEALARMVGRQPEDFPGHTLAQMIPAFAEVLGPVHDRVLRTGEPRTGIEIADTSGAEPRWYVASHYPVRGPDGSVIGLGVSVTDVTRTKRSERSAEESRARLQGLFHHALDAILVFDDTGRLVDANPAACALTGYPLEGLRGLTRAELSGHGPNENDGLWASLIERGSLSGEFELRTKDGDARTVEFRAATNFVPGFHLSILRDVTERNAAESERARLLETERSARALAERSIELMGRLQRLTASLSRAVTEREAVAVVLDQGLEALGAGAGSVLVPDDGQESLRVVEARGYDEAIVRRFETIPMDAHLPAGDAFRSTRPVLLGSRRERDEAYPELAGISSWRALAVVPLIAEGGPIGVLILSFAHDVRFEGPMRAFVVALAEQCAQAFRRARLYEAERDARLVAERSRDVVDRLQAVTGALAGVLTEEGVASVVLDAGLRALGATRGMLAVLRDDALHAIGWSGFPDAIRERWAVMPLGADVPLSETVRTGRPVFLAGPEAWRSRYPALAGEPAESGVVACLPLIGAGDPVGAMALSFRDQHTFSDEERLFMRALGEQCGQALERAHLYQAEREARAAAEAGRGRLTFLAEASHVMTSSLDYETTLERVARLAVPRLADWCSVALLDEAGELRTLSVAHANPAHLALIEELAGRYPMDPASPYGAAAVVRSGKPQLFEEIPDSVLVEVAHDEYHLAALRRLGFASGMVVPLIARGVTLGAITLIQGESGRRCGPADLEFAFLLARRAAQAVDNARLYRESQRTQAELLLKQTLLEVHMNTTTEGTLIVAPDGRMAGYNRRLAEIWGIPEEVLEAGDREEGLRYVLEKLVDPERFLAERGYLYEHPTEFGQGEWDLTDGRVVESWSAPLVAPDGAYHGRAWYFRDVTDRKRTERVLAESRMRAQFLAGTTAALASSMEHREFLPAVASAAAEWMADWCAIDLLHPDGTVERLAIAHRDAARAGAMLETALRRVPHDAAATQGAHRVIATGTHEFGSRIQDAWLDREAGDDPAYAVVLQSLNLRSYMCVPMLTPRGRAIGAITLVTEEGGRAFGPADLAITQELAARAGSAIENARLYEDRGRVAATLQQSLLPPHIPEIPGLEVAVEYVAAGDAFEVGGDFYDVFATGRGDWAVLIGDVCGKGPDAAAITALARHTLRAAAMQSRKPARVLATLNEALLRAESSFCTVAYLRVREHGDAFRVTVTCGGHPLPLLLRDGAVEQVGVPGVLLGSFSETQLTDTVLDLRAGDTLVLYTDGVIEARGPQGSFGEERLRELLERHAREGARDLAATIRRAAIEFQQGDPRDDIAVVAMTVRR